MSIAPNIKDDIKDLLEKRSNQSIEEQIDEARIVVSQINEVDSYAAYAHIREKLGKNSRRVSFVSLLTRVAAVLFVPVLITSGWLAYKLHTSTNNDSLAMQEITSPVGVRSHVVLSDGSTVWLNAESTLKFPVPFQKDIRSVDLKGEAFFEVAKNKAKPFVVNSGGVNVKVLGTRFDCKAFEEDKTIEVILEEGKIALNSTSSSNEYDAVLKPGDHAVIEKSTGKMNIRNEDVTKYIAWHQGKLVFANTPISEVAQMLERWYGVEVVIGNKDILNYRFTTTFDNESIFNVIELLELSSPIQLKYVPASIGPDNKIKTKAKVIINKK
jgi:Fe2+-dicitrate sensor, membrane component